MTTHTTDIVQNIDVVVTVLLLNWFGKLNIS